MCDAGKKNKKYKKIKIQKKKSNVWGQIFLNIFFNIQQGCMILNTKFE